MFRCSLFGILGLLVMSSSVSASDYADDADGEVEEEIEEISQEQDSANIAASETESKQEEEAPKIGPSPDVFLVHLFIQPENSKGQDFCDLEFPGGKPVKFLFGAQNRGERDFIFSSCEASFRYPQDFKYRIQNFTKMLYNRVVAPKQEATFDYAFFASEQYAGRPVGLVVELNYEDSEGTSFVSTIFNETVVITEDDTSFNTETGFLYIIFAAVVVLTLLAGQHFLSKLTRKHGMAKTKHSQYIEMGTNKNEVDFEWIPREVIKQSKSPKTATARPRKALRAE
ncbi:unnamed protein product [Dracunculus medinensis]|uniref:Translocon-associated protein subunit alpha n=1 Tax=Dracunculus medinensis TaxID=318479 RepID=A0A0N4UJ29_DRAME|nr:unnamed protein product [Dracunculus medinensis]